MDPAEILEFSTAIRSLPKEGPGKIVFKDIEISVEACNDSSGPLGELVDILKLSSPVFVAWKYNPNTNKDSTTTDENVPQFSQTWRDSDKRFRVKPELDIDTSNSVLGSPLKLQAIADLSGCEPDTCFSNGIRSNVKGKEYEGLPDTQARYLLSLYNSLLKPYAVRKTIDLKPIFILCDGKNPRQIVCMAVSHSIFTANANATVQTLTKSINVTLSGPKLKKFYTTSAGSNGIGEQNTFISCQAEYNLLSFLNSRAGQQGSLKLEVTWNSGRQLLHCPPVDAMVTAKVQIAPGNNWQGQCWNNANKLYKELNMLTRLVESLSAGGISWLGRKSSEPLVDILSVMLKDLAETGATKASDPESVYVDWLKNEDRPNLDFTDYLWIILMKCSSFSELQDCFQLIFNQIKSGYLQPMVHRKNNSSIAQLIRASYTSSKVYFPDLSSGSLAVEFLAEMGVEKLALDYSHVFLSKDLASQRHLEYFLQKDISLQLKLERLEKLHCVLELVDMMKNFLNLTESQLSAHALEVIEYLEANELDWNKMFQFAVPMQDVASWLYNYQPDVWQCCTKAKKQGRFKETVTRRLSTEMPFSHVDEPSSATCLSDTQCDNSEMGSVMEYFLLTVQDKYSLY